MKRMGILMGAVVIAFLLVAFNSGNPVFANSCCGVKKDAHECDKECESGCIKEVAAAESSGNDCPVCGQAADSKGQQVDVEHGGETAHLCCEGCANAYNENPDKYSESEHPKKQKERDAG